MCCFLLVLPFPSFLPTERGRVSNVFSGVSLGFLEFSFAHIAECIAVALSVSGGLSLSTPVNEHHDAPTC